MTPATVPCVGNQRHALNSCGRATSTGCSDAIRTRVLCRVLAPPEAPGRRPRNASVDVSPTPAPATSSGDFWSSTTTFASQLLSHFRAPAFAAASADAVLREASTKERELQNSKALLDVSAFLSPVGVWELKRIRKLSALTVMTYYMHLVTPRRLLRAHGLSLVATSRTCDLKAEAEEGSNAAEDVVAEGDGMAVSLQDARDVYQTLKRDGGAATSGLSTNLGGSSNIVTLPREVLYQVVAPPQAPGMLLSGGGTSAVSPMPLTPRDQAALAAGPGQLSSLSAPPPTAQGGSGGLTAPAVLPRMLRTPAEVVAAKLAEAAQAATAVAMTSSLASAAESLYAGLASLPIGSALVGANNRASNTLVPPPPPPPSSPPPPAQGSAPASVAVPAASSTEATATTVPAATAATAGGTVIDGTAANPASSNGRLKATAASIASLANEQIRQQTLRGLTSFGRGSTSGTVSVNANGQGPVGPSAATSATSSSASTATSSLIFSSSSTLTCPSEWFVVDDPSTHTRIFVIQGSDTLDHWKLNLTFDPVPFEDPSLGVKVHRGVYEAALVLYERFLPLVYEHLQSSSTPMIAFTGHSIGGSLATLLMLMYRYRGVLPPHTIATVYTFGSPAVFCQSHSHHSHASLPSTSNSWILPSLWSLSSGSSISSISSVEDPPMTMMSAGSSATSNGSAAEMMSKGTAGCACGVDSLFARLELPSNLVRNVIMARDIVPRAFACDYSMVADILKGWGASFKEHCCLNRDGRKHLYYFVGRMYILQPDSWHSFIANDPEHPMLPAGPELYALTDADLQQQQQQQPKEQPPKEPQQVAAPPTRPAARSVTEAIWELMDCPHPLETLADPGAYLATGSISRYHNPENYTKALARLTHLKRLAEGRRVDPRPLQQPMLPVPMAVAASGVSDTNALMDYAKPAVGVPWDSSDGLDLDLHIVGPAVLNADAHACR